MNLLPIPWMKQKLETLYDANLYGNLYLIYNKLDSKDYYITDNSILFDLLDEYNIIVDESHPIYLYLPLEIDSFTDNLIRLFTNSFGENCKIILGGYADNCINFVDKNYDLNSSFSLNLKNCIDHSYLIDNSKEFEIFTSLSDTQNIYIKPESSFSLSGPLLNYHIDEIIPHYVTHISLVTLMDESIKNNFVDYYLKGLTNSNNNFNYNFLDR